MARPHITDRERRHRLVVRHHLGRTAGDVVDATKGALVLHTSDPCTPFLACHARVPDFRTADLESALLEDKSLWRLHAMRRTLFIVPTDEAAIFMAAASRAIALAERKRVLKWAAASIRARNVARWLEKVEAKVRAVLDDGPLRTQELSEAVPELKTRVTLGSGKWAQEAPISSRVLFVMAMDGAIVRTDSTGSWRSSQYRWAATERWFGQTAPPLEPAPARARLLERYLEVHGPVTETDIRWFMGWTAKQTRATLDAIEVAAVDLDDDAEGFVLASDIHPVTKPSASVTFLPALDPSPMGWKERRFYLGDHESFGDDLFDRNGNIGPTVWVDGRVVGGWAHASEGNVAVRLLEKTSQRAAKRIDRHARELEAWLDGAVVTPRFRTPLERELVSAT